MPRHKGLEIHGTRLDRAVVDEVLNGKSYPVPPLRATREIGLVLDIGAHVGAAACWFHELWPTAQIVCYEPSPDTFPLLVQNTPFAHHVQAALGAKGGSAELAVGPETVMSTLYPAKSGPARCGPRRAVVEVLPAWPTLEAHGSPDVIKLDAEGAEVAIAKAAPHVFGDAAVVYLEFHRWTDRTWFDWLNQTHILFSAKIDYSVNRGELAWIHQDAIDPQARDHLLLPE